MIDLEEEFQKLMEEVIDKINDKENAGTYNSIIASNLITKIKSLLDHGDTSRYGNSCPEGHNDPDCGWSPSMGYHCL